ncbi:hypothetical protein [Pseudomonas sp. Marseille-P8916]|uniref:capsular polysaccharide export protein, LipB/KpsS family n=1 Tax=Pseudomonas sp. Marseille-P8916 TaxID=2866589 RepID=UPI001CE489AF|nr:hypothetical protein [Pseudomonas sp. Marseille-P8916]
MKILIQCGDHLENQNRIMALASTLKNFGCDPIVLLYSNKKGRYFENAGIRTVAFEDHVIASPVASGTTIESSLEDGITYNDVLQPEQRRRPKVGWPGQRTRSIRDIHRHYSAINSIIATYKPDKIVVWNGFTGYIANILRLIADNRKIPSAFLERGLLKNSLFIDRLGVNGASSLNEISGDWLDNFPISDLETQKIIELFKIPPEQPEQSGNRRNIFFPLQVQLDTNIIMYSKYRSMRETFFEIYEALNNSTSNFLVRPHPEELPDTLPNIPRFENVKVSTDETLDYWLEWSDLVVTINSTVGLEALIKGKRVISLGGSIYSSAGLTSSLSKELNLSNSQIRARLIKYLAYLTKSNLLLPDSEENHIAVSKQLDIPIEQYTPTKKNHCEPIPFAEKAVIEVDLPLNTTVDLTYRKNKVKIDQAWIISIAQKHIAAKSYSISLCGSAPASPTAIKIISEEKTAKADPRYSKTIDIYGNLVR